MTTIQELAATIQKSWARNYGEDLPGTWIEHTTKRDWVANDKELWKAFSLLMQNLRKDEQNYQRFAEEWMEHIEMEEDEEPGITLEEVVDNIAEGKFPWFEGTTIRELYEQQYSDSLTNMQAQQWECEWRHTEGTVSAYAFSHRSYDNYDSWVIVIDQDTQEHTYVSI